MSLLHVLHVLHGSIRVHLTVCSGSLVEGCVHLVWCVYLCVQLGVWTCVSSVMCV